LQHRPYRKTLKASELPPKYPEKEILQKVVWSSFSGALCGKKGWTEPCVGLQPSCCIEVCDGIHCVVLKKLMARADKKSMNRTMLKAK
jgi:hypothetical protein